MWMDQEVQRLDDCILDHPYLDDMREWVGDDVIATLLSSAPEALRAEIASLRAAWERADLAEIREVGHRLKGAAGSVACRRLASMGQMIQTLPDLPKDAGFLDPIADAVEEAAISIAAYVDGLAIKA